MQPSQISVCLTVESLSPESGGPAQTVSALASHLVTMGVDVTLLSNSQYERGQERGVGFYGALRDHIEREQRLIVHDNGIWLPSNHQAVRCATKYASPLVISPRGMLEPWALRQRKWKKRLAWWLYQCRDLRRAAVLHATADQEAVHIRRLGLGRPIAVIPNGVELPQWSGCNIAQTTPMRTAVFLSRIHPKKGLLNLVQAWKRISPRDWRVVIAGPDEGGHEAVVRAAVRSAGLDGIFEFAGPAYGNKKWELLRNADLFILPTFSENFGVVVAEALAVGVPVITTKGAPWELLEKRGCGWWVEIGVEPLARALDEATKAGDAGRRVMGERGRALVEERFTWPRVAEQMKRVYEWVLGAGPMPECVTLL